MINWAHLPFAYHKTHTNVRSVYANNTWGALTSHTDENLSIHMAASCLHYGQECFEGLKAFRGKDNTVRIFRWEENLKRMNKSANRLSMPSIPEHIFKQALIQVIQENKEFIPPYGTGASLYFRPLLIGSSARLGLSPADEYMFVLFCSPVGPYFKTGIKPVKIIVERETDRAAPLGTGNVKVGGNYAPALSTTQRVQKLGYSSALYLDPKEKKYIDECGPANFFGIKNNTYITPQSESILESITNKSLQTVASEILGLSVEKRKVPLEELADFEETAQCGTAAVLTPIYEIYDPTTNIRYTYGDEKTTGKICSELYKTLYGIQTGDITDSFGWNTLVEI
ncbi:MAG: branched-chain amino acid aminotransferase [Bacteroidales bacterium]